MPTLFRYVVIDVSDNDTEYIFTDDASGWDELTTALIRGSLHGINSEQTAPLKFALEAREFLRGIFIQYGAFAKLKLRIDLRNDDWSYSEYVTYYFDFKTFNDDLDYVSIELKENSLRELIESKMDTEYDVTVIENNEVPMVGLINKLPFLSTNTIQSKSGDLLDNGSTGDDIIYRWGKIRGSRTDYRTFSTHYTFTYSNGFPFDSMLFYTIKPYTNQKIKFRINLQLTINTNTVYPVVGERFLIRIIKDNNGNKTELASKTPTSIINDLAPQGDPRNVNLIFTNNEEEITILNLVEGDGIYMEVYSELYNYRILYSQTISNNNDTYIKIIDEINSDAGNNALYFFTHEKAISRVLSEISPDAVLDYKLTDENYIPALTSSRTINDMLQPTFTGFSKIPLKLKDLFDSLDLLYNIGVDISGDTVTVDYIENFYKQTKTSDLECTGVKLSYNDKLCYNNIVIGTNTEKELNVTYGLYSPFTEKTFSISENVINADINDLKLVHPYKIDMYSIDKWLTEMFNNEAKKKDDTGSEIAMVALDPTPIDNYYYPVRAESINFTLTQDVTDYYNIPFTPKRFLINKIKSISPIFYGSESAILKFSSNKLQLAGGFESKMYYEDATIVEDDDMDFTDVDKLYLPLSIGCSSVVDYDLLKTIKENKYGYIEITDRDGNTYHCYISKLLSKIGKTSAQEYEFIVKSIQ